ncbi:hypothetical protein [Phaeacidiphilus oryzae]|uniref:hypothetical protein n=1 Tax=Phaeacidiphilus oryzae TaxID=348818 RepID=UPI00068AF517|nr:hypothetical protein [Phaeacidiphilus oryzae]
MERHTVIALLILAIGGETALAVVGGGAAAGVGAALLLAAIAVIARFALGAAATDGVGHDRLRLLSSREPSLRQLAGAVDDALGTQDGYEWRLRPVLERLYAARLAEGYGVSLHTERSRAAALVGPDVWPWIDPSRPGGTDPAPPPHTARHAGYPRPVPAETVTALVERLESLRGLPTQLGRAGQFGPPYPKTAEGPEGAE